MSTRQDWGSGTNEKALGSPTGDRTTYTNTYDFKKRYRDSRQSTSITVW